MNNIKLMIIISSLLVIISGCAAPQAKVDFDKNSKIDTSHYQTFAWLNEAKILAPAIDINPVMKVRVDEAIEAAFISKGYQLIDDAKKADFAISYSVGNREKIKVHSYPVAYRSRFSWGGGYHRGRYNDLLITTETQVTQYTEGKLAIDVYDVTSHQPAWHGWAIKRLSAKDKEVPSASIKAIIEKVVAQF
ncbi:DUF4136 domain-containing protein [Psychromonas hadalis]|uniref:DUF4136 domain-containing protein n=1 Tax=Psychromonas hadalis TaxID=211669 RepID=UPI0003B64FCB|nr:DUF4136 domain-containing protein [Psychromonas hadalis]